MNSTIAIAFYNRLLGLSIAESLGDFSEISAIHQVSDFSSLKNVLESKKVNYLMIDEFFTEKYQLPHILELTQKNNGVKIIYLSENKDVSYVRDAFANGIAAFLTPNTNIPEIKRVLKILESQNRFISADILIDFANQQKVEIEDQRSLNQRTMMLTDREKDILRELGKEKKPTDIATELNMSVYTVNFHLKNLRRKLNSKNTIGLVRYSLQNQVG